MSARILVADDIKANRRLLEAKLQHEYFDVITAMDGVEVLEKVATGEPDVILLDVMMPRLDGIQTCKQLKADPKTEHIPVVMITALGDREDRLRCLEAGADDFLTKPIDDLQLMSRIRALTRYKLVVDELRRREANARHIGAVIGTDLFAAEPARILIIDEDARQAERIRHYLRDENIVFTWFDTDIDTAGVDLIILALPRNPGLALRMCARIHSSALSRDLPILIIAGIGQEKEALRALDLGASDIIIKPLDAEELLARTRTQARRKHYMEALRQRLDRSVIMAVTDQLTSLHNRHYFTGRLDNFVRRTNMGGGPVSLLVADLDNFKQVNDNYGHEVGDMVLIEFASRLRSNIRPGDIACRLGGEEFVVLMPETSHDTAMQVSDRVRLALMEESFLCRDLRLSVTMSGGVASILPPGDSADAVIRRADEALYRAKRLGRNRIESEFAGSETATG